MSSSLAFSSSGAFLNTKYKHRNTIEIPQHILPFKVHSSTGNVSTPDVLLSRENDHEPKSSCTLKQVAGQEETASLILDFRFAVAGIPVIRVATLQHTSLPVLLDLTYSEGFPGIERHGGDGPFPFSAGADTQRRNRFRIRGPGFYEAKHVQGSQRWMKITLASKQPCSISLSLAAFKPTTENTPLDQLPGYFACSDTQLTDLWGYGARTLQLNCIPARTVPPPWQVSEDMGILVDSQRCNAYGWGGGWGDYEVKFEGMVIEGGLCWGVRMQPIGGHLFVLNVDAGATSTTLELWFGLYNKPQKTLVPLLLESQELKNRKIEASKWYNIKCVCVGTEVYRVFIDGQLVGTFKTAASNAPKPESLSFGPQGFPQGSIGFGAGEDQICRFRNVTVKSANSDEILYTSGLNNPSVLGDFGINWNPLPYIFDGAKRDRYAWTADIITGGPALYYSTAGLEYIRGNIEASMMRSTARNGAAGLLPGGIPPGREFERSADDTMFKVLSASYSLYLILAVYDFWLYTGDDLLVSTYWEQMQGCLKFMEELANDDGLISVEGMAAMDYDYYNGQQAGVATKRNVLYVAVLRKCATMAQSAAIDDPKAAQIYLSQANRTAESINKHLFNPETGHYKITADRPTGFQQETNAWLLTTGIAPEPIQASLLQKLNALYTGTHNNSPTQFSQDTPNVPRTISPITSTFHILACLQAGDVSSAEHIFRTVWAPMCDVFSPHFTGTTWEFMNPDGTPFEDQFCSYAQLFSVGPTSILSRFVLGVEPVTPGYKTFLVAPRFKMDGVRWAAGRVPTPVGEPIVVRWELFGVGWRLWCKTPGGLNGVARVPEEVWVKRRSLKINEVEKDHEEQEIRVGGADGGEVDIEIYF
ncbi:hypothetical protein ONS95_014433 [Cadophora gregata]|uniref:uncharacterized protein n=1 Tax=Cadophora gregata TaxID=51156 RepID=UPI0026DCD81C|nr:uncharacterized protein ONS95_014433 [Cadophora gregata]KAK0112695.1 hypothetical protein ONS95_014433 [Cadophora gregata]KAK0124828.1 hypothetical protein ONS96_008709 [Cadophora gregata f. sp. sojae]